MNNGFINDNYILTAIEADCYGKKETFFIKAKKYDTEGFIMYIEFILAIEDHFFGETKYEVCEKTSHKIPFDIESVTEYAKDYLKDNALTMYSRLKRRLQAKKPSVSFSYYDEDYCYENIRYEEDRMCISIPRNILGKEVCDIIKTSDGHAEIAFDEEADAVKIYQSIEYEYEGCRRYIKGIKIGETSVRSFLNWSDPNEKSNEDFDEEQAFFGMFENKSEETTVASEEDVVLV